MSRAGLQHALARVLEGKEIRLKNNKLPLQPRCIERFTIPRVKTHWPVIFAIALTDPDGPWPILSERYALVSTVIPGGQFPRPFRMLDHLLITFVCNHFNSRLEG